MSHYNDFNFNFESSAADIKIVEDEESINQSIKNILFTKPGEVFFNPLFGSGIHHLLFEKIDIITETLLTDEIKYAIENFEPRVQIINISFSADHDLLSYSINIDYIILKLNTLGSVNISLQMQSI